MENTPWRPQVELLALDLLSLVGYGLEPHLVKTRTALIDLVRDNHDPDVPWQVLAYAAIEEVKKAWRRLPPPEARAIEYELILSRRADLGNVLLRRLEAMKAMGKQMSDETWRKGPEPKLMRVLAIEMLFPSAEEQTA